MNDRSSRANKMFANFLLRCIFFSLLITESVWSARRETIFQRTYKVLHSEPPVSVVNGRGSTETCWIEQPLDHFNKSDKRTWQMRYMTNNEFWQRNGPLFIYVGGEWEISPGFITGGHFYDMAKEHNGYLIYTEHRYYGQSRPTSDVSTEKMKYLSVRQSLADLAYFIRTVRETIAGLRNSKVILAGASYSAAMVTWFKKLHPDLATGCWASSAPLFAKVDFFEYKEIIGNSIRLIGGRDCYHRIRNGIAKMEAMFASRRGAEIKAMMKMCDNFDEDNNLDIWTLFNLIADIFAAIVQSHSNGEIQTVCSRIMEAETDLSGLITLILDVADPTPCNDVTYKTYLESFTYTDYNDQTTRQWTYQTCNEFGWFQTSKSKDQPFGTKFPLNFFTTLCGDLYGRKFTNSTIHKSVDGTNSYFGGLESAVENVYFSHGELDPWRAMGIQDKQLATIIPMYTHCKDFNSISDSDTPEMRASKEKIAQLVRKWLNESDNKT